LRDLDADQIIIAIPARDAAKLLQSTHPDQANLLKTWRYTSSGTLSLAYRSDEITPPAGFGFMTRNNEPADILGCTWTTNKFDHRAPANHFIARVFFGDPLPDEASMLNNARRELKRLAGIDAPPLFYRAYRWPNANPQYDVGHIDRMAQLREDTDLLFIGSSYDGFSISDCITFAKKMPDLVLG
jgi:oxygen-dependent protoporphyrinogen oxidase